MTMTEADSRYGHFSYGAVGVPVSEYDALKAGLAPVLADYLKLVPGGETEFKHTEFKRIPFLERATIGHRIAVALIKRGAFVSGFYTPAQMFVMEHVRDNVMEAHDALPDDLSDLYREAVEEVREEDHSQRNKAELLSTLLTLPVSGAAHMLAEFECPIPHYL